MECDTILLLLSPRIVSFFFQQITWYNVNARKNVWTEASLPIQFESTETLWAFFFLFSPAKNTELVRQQHTIRCAMCVFCLSANAEYPNPCIHLHTVLSTHELFIDSMNEIKIHTFRSSCMWSSLHWRRNNSYCDITRASVCCIAKRHPTSNEWAKNEAKMIWCVSAHSSLL